MQELVVYDSKCPYNCVKGVLFNPRTHQKMRCPHCAKLRQDEVYNKFESADNTPVEEKLGLRTRGVSKTEYSFESLFRGGTNLVESESLTDVKQQLDDLISLVSLGDLPKYSMLFNLGARVFEQNFVNPVLIRAYLSGIDVAPLQTVYSISKMRRYVESQEYDDKSILDDYERCLNCSLCVIVLDEGITRSGVDTVKGFVYQRGRLGKPSVVLTLSNLKPIMYDFATNSDDFDYSVPKLISIKYKNSEVISQEFKGSVEQEEKSVSSAPQISMTDLNMLTSNSSFM